MIDGPRPRGARRRPGLHQEASPASRYNQAMRVLGVDLGHKRIGLAISDEDGEFAFPAGILESRGRRRDVAALCALIGERGIQRAVVGLPIHMDGRRGPEAENAERFARELGDAAHIPVETLDERWTSREAETLMRGTSGRRRREKRGAGRVDEMAASILLRTYLARLKNVSDTAASESAGTC
ncbi:MAG: Holliday junction resolvase RuvX [Deltaproteobacteria bacterium]|nr:Holliday junction resolvase RuvX [Deltaproteobacteria bacterium]